jgi:hypothetical protein
MIPRVDKIYKMRDSYYGGKYMKYKNKYNRKTVQMGGTASLDRTHDGRTYVFNTEAVSEYNSTYDIFGMGPDFYRGLTQVQTAALSLPKSFPIPILDKYGEAEPKVIDTLDLVRFRFPIGSGIDHMYTSEIPAFSDYQFRLNKQDDKKTFIAVRIKSQ